MKDIAVGKRIRKIRESQKMSQTEFAGRIGLTQTSLSMIETATSNQTKKNIKLICSTYHVNEDWLLTGEGDMYAESPMEKEFVVIFRSLLPETRECLLLMANELLAVQEKLLRKPEGGAE